MSDCVRNGEKLEGWKSFWKEGNASLSLREEEREGRPRGLQGVLVPIPAQSRVPRGPGLRLHSDPPKLSHWLGPVPGSLASVHISGQH